MSRLELAIIFPVALAGGCAVDHDAAVGAETATVKRTRYAITEIPVESASDRSQASRAVCAHRAAVGYATSNTSGTEHAILFDARGITRLPTLGGRFSRGYAATADGAIVGESSTAGFRSHAFVFRDGVMTDLGTLGGAFSSAWGINADGDIVGQATLITGGDVPSHATLWTGGQAIDLGTLGGAESFARDINNDGVIVGAASAAVEEFRAHAVVWRDGVIEALPANGALHGVAAAINNAGTIAGSVVYVAGQPWHAVVWRDGVMTDLGNFGSSAFALGLDESGDVVGMAWDASGSRPHAFLYTKHDELLDLETLVDNGAGWQLLQAVDVCNDGRIVGNGNLFGANRGFVLTPVR